MFRRGESSYEKFMRCCCVYHFSPKVCRAESTPTRAVRVHPPLGASQSSPLETSAAKMLCLQVDGALAVVAGNNVVPLAELVGFRNGEYSVDACHDPRSGF